MNVLDVMDEAQDWLYRSSESRGDDERAAAVQEARAAVAELIDYAESAVEYVAKCADAVDVNHRMAGRPDSLNVARTIETNLRAALARAGGV